MGYAALHRKWNKTRDETGYRSGFEAQVASSLPEDALYEPCSLPYPVNITANYKPDFVLPEQAIILEVKGRFTEEDRAKMLRVKRHYPDLDIRILFQSLTTKLTKTLTHESWCKKNGFLCAKGPSLPAEWLTHKPDKKSRTAFNAVFTKA